MPRARVFLAMSLDGFIAGPNDELDWLTGREGVEDTFTPFFRDVGAMLMGRGTYDVVSSFETWPYGETPVLVATGRPFDPPRGSVEIGAGGIAGLVARAKELAGDRDVYVDGGALVRAALGAGLVDELIVTVVPVLLGRGKPLFAEDSGRHELELVSSRPIGGGLVQLVYAVEGGGRATG